MMMITVCKEKLFFYSNSTDKNGFKKAIFNKKEYYINSVPISIMGWSVVQLNSVNENPKQLKNIRNLGIIIILITILIMLLIEGAIISSIRRPINKIVNFTKAFNEDSKDKRLDIVENNELGILGKYINGMLDKLDLMNKKIVSSQLMLYEIKLAKKSSELNALQSQINPHFFIQYIGMHQKHSYI